MLQFGGDFMKIALVSGFLNDHLLPICEELNKKCEFQFIATQDLSQNPQQYKQELTRPYVTKAYTDKSAAESIVQTYDVVIFGGSSDQLLALRKKTGKISFVYTERFFKKGSFRRFIPTTRKTLNKRFIENNENLYVLCSGSFVAKDLKLIGFDTNKCFKFGYFPKTQNLAFEELLQKKASEKLQLLFVGRLLKLKRAIDTLKCCEKLKNANINFELYIIGDGPQRRFLEDYAKKHGLSNVCFLGSKNKDEVLEYMQQSHLCFVNSNRMEGWAAVINEAMSQACPVIASNTCGATAYLINDGANGFSYKVGNIKDLYNKASIFANSKNKADFYQNAFSTISNEWNATVAVERFLNLSNAIMQAKDTDVYTDGPLSHT